jgi:hypothetical protein
VRRLTPRNHNQSADTETVPGAGVEADRPKIRATLLLAVIETKYQQSPALARMTVFTVGHSISIYAAGHQ